MVNNVISATEARNRWFEILNIVYFRGEPIIIEKNNIPIVKLIPMKKPQISSTTDAIKKTYGFLKGIKTYWPAVDKKISEREIKYADRLWKQ